MKKLLFVLLINSALLLASCGGSGDAPSVYSKEEQSSSSEKTPTSEKVSSSEKTSSSEKKDSSVVGESSEEYSSEVYSEDSSSDEGGTTSSEEVINPDDFKSVLRGLMNKDYSNFFINMETKYNEDSLHSQYGVYIDEDNTYSVEYSYQTFATYSLDNLDELADSKTYHNGIVYYDELGVAFDQDGDPINIDFSHFSPRSIELWKDGSYFIESHSNDEGIITLYAFGDMIGNDDIYMMYCTVRYTEEFELSYISYNLSYQDGTISNITIYPYIVIFD